MCRKFGIVRRRRGTWKVSEFSPYIWADLKESRALPYVWVVGLGYFQEYVLPQSYGETYYFFELFRSSMVLVPKALALYFHYYLYGFVNIILIIKKVILGYFLSLSPPPYISRGTLKNSELYLSCMSCGTLKIPELSPIDMGCWSDQSLR